MLATEETALITRAQSGDGKARETILNANLPLVPFLCGRFYPHPPPYIDSEDLLSEGYIGLTESLDTFDLARGVRFCTWAGWRIRQAMSHFVKQSEPDGPAAFECRRMLRRAEADLAALGKEATDENLSQITRQSLPRVAGMRLSAERKRFLPLQGKPDPRSKSTWADLIPSDVDIERDCLREESNGAVQRAIGKLPAADQRILMLRYRDGASLKEAGAALGISREGARQKQQKAERSLLMRLMAVGFSP